MGVDLIAVLMQRRTFGGDKPPTQEPKMPPAKEMPPIKNERELRAAAVERRRVRVRGVVAQTGDGYSGRYRNRWLEIEAASVSVRVTAGLSSPLGTAPAGTEVDVALTLTGMVDVSSGVYFGHRAQLVAMVLPPS